jgi:predicted CxxxxCH...CXXCH cytochrome family protein
MPPLTTITKTICMAALCTLMLACGKANDKAPALDSSNHHPNDWRVAHRAAYQQNGNQCRECHGMDLRGGISKIDCFNQAGLGQCHAGGHGPRSVPHQLPFKNGTVHGPTAKSDLTYCQSCHGTSGGPGSNPRFNVQVGSMQRGCEDCHEPFTAHLIVAGSTSVWPGHGSAGNMGNSCTLCHGALLTGGVGPACSSCHTALTAGAIPTAGACVSCHGKPPVSGSHTIHNALAGITNVCSSCHNDAGSGSVLHRNGTAEVAIATVYNAKAAVALKNTDGSCSNVSCHGGITTPPWGGSLTSGCRSCHSPGTAQYNSFNSGQHDLHINEVGLQCTDCHAMTVNAGGAGHYGNLATSVFELAPSATIRIPGYPTCNPGRTPAAGTYSVGVCHGSQTWR